MNFLFSVRYYTRAAGTRRRFLKLKSRVWCAVSKKAYYITTDVLITPKEFRKYIHNDKAVPRAPLALQRDIDYYNAAISYVFSALVVNGRIHSVTSAWISARVKTIVARMRENAEGEKSQLIVVGASPCDSTAYKCKDCIFRGLTCAAPWQYSYQTDAAPEFASQTGDCSMYQQEGGES